MKRPTGVTILGVLAYLAAVLLVLAGLLSFFAGSFAAKLMANAGSSVPASIAGIIGGAIGVVFILFAVLYFATGYGLMALKNWGRIITIILSILSILGSLLGFTALMHGFAMFVVFWALVRLVISIVILWYLFQPEVKQAFGAA
jgi:hypothetical protein